jgi:hypothetical protein
VRELRLRLNRIFGDRTENRLTVRFAELSGLDDRHVLDLLKGANSVGHVWWEFLEAVEQASANAPAHPHADQPLLFAWSSDVSHRAEARSRCSAGIDNRHRVAAGRESSANGQTRQARWLANGSRRCDWVEVPAAVDGALYQGHSARAQRRPISFVRRPSDWRPAPSAGAPSIETEETGAVALSQS